MNAIVRNCPQSRLLRNIQRPLTQVKLVHLRTSHLSLTHQRHQHQQTTMSDHFSNTNTGDKPADPYKKANMDNEVPLAQKIQDLSDFMSNCKFCMMTTHDAKTGHLASRCMALAAKVCSQLPSRPMHPFNLMLTRLKETGGIDLLFHTNTESGKTDELKSDSHINIAFQNMTGEWASVSGIATVVTDRSLVKQHYSPQLKAWLGDLGDGVHDGTENDPRIGIIRVKMVTAHYSISSKNIIGRVAEVAQGTITGKPAAVNKLREISEDEVKKWRSSH